METSLGLWVGLRPYPVPAKGSPTARGPSRDKESCFPVAHLGLARVSPSASGELKARAEGAPSLRARRWG